MERIETPKSIIVRLPNWVGDVVMATPFLKSLRNGYPEAHITLYAKEHLGLIVEGLDIFDEFLPYKQEKGKIREIFSNIRLLKKFEFDLGILLTNSFGSAYVFRKARIKNIVGYARNCRTFLLTHPIEPPRENGKIKHIPTIDYYLKLVGYLGPDIPDRTMELVETPEAKKQARTILEKHHINWDIPTVIINPGGAFGAAKCYPTQYFARVGDLIMEKHDINLIVVNGPNEKEIARSIEIQMNRKPITLVAENITLDLFKSVINASQLLITNDSGLRHFGIAFDKPVITIFGPTDPALTEPYYDKEIIIRKDLECSPCQKKTCPLDHSCMQLITPEEVYEQAKSILSLYLSTGKENANRIRQIS